MRKSNLKNEGPRRILTMRIMRSDRKPNTFEITIRIPNAQTSLFSAHRSESYRLALILTSLNLKEEENVFCISPNFAVPIMNFPEGPYQAVEVTAVLSNSSIRYIV